MPNTGEDQISDTQIAHILYVEDSIDDFVLAKVRLKHERVICHLHTAANSDETFAFLGKKGAFVKAPTPDLILLDINLPGITGHEILEEIKKDHGLEKIPVVMISGSKAEEDINRAYGLGAIHYLFKPLGVEGLSEAILKAPNLTYQKVGDQKLIYRN